MLDVRTIDKIKTGAKITYFNGIYAIFIGVVYLIFFKFLLKVDFKAIDAVWQVFAKYNPEINSIFIRLLVMKGLFVIAIGILIIYLSDYIIRKKEKDTWIALFIIGIIFWPSLLTFEILDKNVYTITATAIGWLTFIIGMIIPIRYYTKKDYGDY